MTGTITDLLAGRESIRRELTEGTQHVLATLRGPSPAIANVPIGDLLCWCQGMHEAAVARILTAAEINWGRPVRLLSKRDQEMLCFQIKVRHPDTWERWRETLRERHGLPRQAA